jgi:phage tail sheath protein FI
MPITPTYPGVYIEELPSGVRTIVGVATSVAAFIDRFARGPIDVPLRMLSVSDFEREYGGLAANSEASYQIRQFFLNGGTEAHVVRVSADDDDVAEVLLASAGTDILQVTTGRRVGRVPVEDPGAWGNGVRIEVDYDTTDPAALFNIVVSEVAEENNRMIVRRTETFRNLTLEPGASNNALEVVNADSKLVQVAEIVTPPDPFDPTFRPDATGTLGGALPGTPAIPADGAEVEITVNPGGGAADLAAVTATIDYGTATPPTSYAGFRRFLEAAIRAAAPTDPLFAGATIQLTGNRYRVLLGRTGAGFEPDAVIRFDDSGSDTTATDLVLTEASGAVVSAQMFALTGGTDGGDLSDGVLRGTRSAKTGIYALEDADLINILCIPAAAELADQNAMRAVYAEALAYCEERRAFLLVDIPEAINEVAEMETWLDDNALLRGKNAAVYFPRVRLADPLNQNRLTSFGASGTIAGLYATTDANRGVWKAPAGTDARLRNVQALDYVLTDRENGVLNPLGVNCARTFPVFGTVAWGARTLEGADVMASESKYIPVRRTTLMIEESLYRGTKWAVFEPNDEPLWAQLRLNIGAFMQNLFRQGAFQGRTPREAYLVKCDRETTTQDDINRGIVNILVGFAPLKPAEFVFIRIQQLAGQVEA